MSLDHVLGSSIVVCTGSGGVGKTTISAAIALEAAIRGKRTVVVTIDPARRLAVSLGLAELSNKATPVDVTEVAPGGIDGRLDALMLDTKSTFDELIHRYARSEARARRIIDNRFYQAISDALSGTNEYMAMEKLYELHTEGVYDLIVIDTPPTRNALDFLDAPKKMTDFLEGRLLKWFLLPAMSGGRGLFKIANFAAVQFLKAIQKVIGSDVLAETAEFFKNFEGMYEGFKERAQSVFELLRDPSTSFVVVTAPTEQSVDEAVFFASALNSYELNFGGLVVNRVNPTFVLHDLPEAATDEVAALVELARKFEHVRVRQERSLDRLTRQIPRTRWAHVPALTRDVYDLAALAEVASFLFETSAIDEPAEPAASA